MSKRVVTLPNGRKVGLGQYVRAWRQLRNVSPETVIRDWDYGSTKAGRILTEMRRGIDVRINHHIPGFGVGRKWTSEWQADARRTAGEVNTPRRAIHWLPADLRHRLAHRQSA